MRIDFGTGMTLEQRKEMLLFTIAKILRAQLIAEMRDAPRDIGAIQQDINSLDDVIGDFRNYIPYQQAPGG